jgi:hypothetical protein
MAEDKSKTLEGPVDSTSYRVECKANGAIPQWSPVVLVAPGTGEELPRVGTTTSAGDTAHFGIKDAPNKTLAAGDICWVVVRGITKCKFAGAASRGALFQTSASAGKAQSLTLTAIGDVPKIMGKVLSSIVAADNDIGLVEVGHQ